MMRKGEKRPRSSSSSSRNNSISWKETTNAAVSVAPSSSCTTQPPPLSAPPSSSSLIIPHKSEQQRLPQQNRSSKHQPATLSSSSFNNHHNYPYATEYNDHFETPIEAYQDIQPLFDWWWMTRRGHSRSCVDTADDDITLPPPSRDSDNNDSNNRNNRNNNEDAKLHMRIYDPYYCAGQTRVLLESLGYQHVIHAKQDFYNDIEQNRIPFHDILVTNPPYSDTHKQQCLHYCFSQLRTRSNSCCSLFSDDPFKATTADTKTKSTTSTTTTTAQPKAQPPLQSHPTSHNSHHHNSSSSSSMGIPFLLLMPSYTATKQYYRDCLYINDKSNNNNDRNECYEDVVYLIPSTSYHYHHPDETGKDTCPFASLWFCGIGKDNVASFRQFWQALQQQQHGRPLPTLALTLSELQSQNVVSFHNRPNPRKRRKKKQHQPSSLQQQQLELSSQPPPLHHQKPSSVSSPSTHATTEVPMRQEPPTTASKKSRSKYRDSTSGKRIKKRF